APARHNNCQSFCRNGCEWNVSSKVFKCSHVFICSRMKETAAKRREKPKDSKAEKQKESAGPEPQDVEMPEEDSAAAAKQPKELDSLTLEGRLRLLHVQRGRQGVPARLPGGGMEAFSPPVLLYTPMDTEGDVQFRPRTGKAAATPLIPEVEAYLQLLLVVYLTNNKRYTEAQKVSDELLQKISSQNRRALDLVAAKCYYYHSRVYEFLNQLDAVRSFLHTRLRTATLRHDADGQATLLNLLLRNYLQYNLYDQAEKLVSKSIFPELANNNEWARYLYYTGRIKAIQLEYSEARRTLTNALRKAPQHTAVGFKQTVHKLLIVVELLLGEIPDRLQFRQPSLKRSLMPYFLLTQAVRTGNLAKFNQVLDQFGEKFQTDGTYTLIIRLRHNVIKTGVRMISLSYSRISLADIAQKLQLDSPEDAEFIVAKAIRDGVIEASINHEKGYVQSKETMDIYGTREPQLAFHQRISFCLDIHNMSVKAMRFPPKAYNKDLESAEERREREQQDLEFAKEMAEDDDDSFP
uniref:26S proteasome non-ATPase regulatory subunit 3 n=1 Tax=Denticeps clupeoides TaxID=299321 RepID=A0AAY4C4F1_9TELE